VINLIRSASITIAVSLALSGVFLLANLNFWVTFFVSLLGQFIVFFIVGSVLEFINELKAKELNALRIAEFSKQGMEVECPCYKKVKEFVPITLNAKNMYKCSDCKKNVSVYITTETVYVSDATVPEINLDV
jgi:hypothetical protein